MSVSVATVRPQQLLSCPASLPAVLIALLDGNGGSNHGGDVVISALLMGRPVRLKTYEVVVIATKTTVKDKFGYDLLLSGRRIIWWSEFLAHAHRHSPDQYYLY